jgi:hypothetical protein
MPRGNVANLIDPAKRKKMNTFYATDMPKFLKFLGKNSLDNYQKSFIMKRAWASVDGRHETEYPYSSLAAYVRANKATIDRRAEVALAKREKKKEDKLELKIKEKAKKIKEKAKAKK